MLCIFPCRVPLKFIVDVLFFITIKSFRKSALYLMVFIDFKWKSFVLSNVSFYLY